MAAPAANVELLTGDPRIDGLLQGSAWTFSGGPHTLTYSFSVDDLQPVAWPQSFRNAFVLALTGWSNVADLTFVESDSGSVFTASQADLAGDLTGAQLRRAFGTAIGQAEFPDPPLTTRTMLP